MPTGACCTSPRRPDDPTAQGAVRLHLEHLPVGVRPVSYTHLFGTYNVTCDGPTLSWFDIAARVYELSGRSASDVSPQSTEEYAAGKVVSPRPTNSTLSLAKIKATGLELPSTDAALTAYLARERA